MTTTAEPTAEPQASTRERLIAAALEVFREEGYERARVQDIARAAGLTTGAIYANYRGKADLLLDAITTGSTAEVDTLLRVAQDLPARDLLEALGTRIVFREHERLLLLDAIVASRRDPQLATLLRERFDERHTQFVTILERARGEGVVDDTLDLDSLTRFCITLALGALVGRALDLPVPDRDGWGELITRLLDAVAPQKENS